MILSLKSCLLVLLTVATVSTKGKLVAFWHIFRGGAFRNIITEQELALNRSGLFPVLDKIYYAVSGPEDLEDFSFNHHEKFEKLKHHGKRSVIHYYTTSNNFSFASQPTNSEPINWIDSWIDFLGAMNCIHFVCCTIIVLVLTMLMTKYYISTTRVVFMLPKATQSYDNF